MIYKKVLLVLVILFCGCMKSTPISETDKEYIFIFADIEGINHSTYTKKKNTFGTYYLFLKGKSPLDEPNNSYSVMYNNKNSGDECNLMSMVSVFSTPGRAKQLFNSQMMLRKSRKVDNKIKLRYQADDIYIDEQKNNLFVLIRKHNKIYEIDINGLNINFSNVDEKLLKKYNHFLSIKLE